MTDGAATIEISVLSSLDEIEEAAWDACAAPAATSKRGRPQSPFTTWRFLRALEVSGSVGDAAGWTPRHLVARLDGQVIGVAPLYAKMHSQGEYVFDHNWAHAYENAGGDYYPKLQCAAPFTPATSPRLLSHPDRDADAVRAALMEGAIQLAAQHGVSSVHVTFCTEQEYRFGGELGLLQRTGQQFHWENPGYGDFEAFLASLSSRKRKAVRKERRVAAESGCEILSLTGDQIEPDMWDAVWRFYQDTGSRKWGRPYLTRAFFDQAQEHLRDDILLVMCRREGRWVAGALNLIGADTLFGRYWGCVEDHPCLHFEVCYYRAIDYAIEHGLRVEAGAQGAHKLARGYLAVPTYSIHWIADPGFRRAVADYLDAERRAVEDEIAYLDRHSPFRQVGAQDFEEGE